MLHLNMVDIYKDDCDLIHNDGSCSTYIHRDCEKFHNVVKLIEPSHLSVPYF